MPCPIRMLLALAMGAAIPLAAPAQAQFSMNNPLIKPAARGMAASAPVAPKETPKVPVAHPVADAANPPWPGAVPAGGGGGLPSQSTDSAVRDELSAYTVVAIVGDAAVLRTNVGAAVAGGPSNGGAGGGAGAAPPMGHTGNAAGSSPLLRQQTLRVHTGQAVTVASASVVPTVRSSTVEFRSATGKGALLFTASLDSQSPQAFVPATKEAADPAVAARATPTPPSINGLSSTGSATGASSGAAGTTSR